MFFLGLQLLAARRQERLDSLKQELEAKHPTIKVSTFELDVRVKAKVNAAIEYFGDVDILVNNAGKIETSISVRVSLVLSFALLLTKNIFIFSKNLYTGLVIGLDKLEDITEEAMDTMFDTNVKGLVYVTQAVIPGMRARNKGHVINIGSVAGQQAYGNGSIYCATKAAVASITRALMHETIDTAIRVSEINPGKKYLKRALSPPMHSDDVLNC